jgi:hypothetical protein
VRRFGKAKPPRRTIGWAALFILSLMAAPISRAAALNDSAVLPRLINEASGLAASRQAAGVYWTHNDNIDLPASSRKSQPILFAINTEGELLSRVTLAGITQRDWEAITEAELNATPTLIVGDIGDNRGTWLDYRLWFVPEPAALSPQMTRTPTALLRFRYPEQTAAQNQAKEKHPTSGTQKPIGFDAESMAFDPRRQEILILTKREKPARLFALPINARTALSSASPISQQIRQAPITTARFLANLPTLPAPDFVSWLLHPFISPYADQPTDMALSPDGSTLAVLTYSGLFFFHRTLGQSWQTALKQPTQSQALPFIDQWEGISYSTDGKTLILVREGSGADTLIQLPAPD